MPDQQLSEKHVDCELHFVYDYPGTPLGQLSKVKGCVVKGVYKEIECDIK